MYLVRPIRRHGCEMFAVYLVLDDGTGRLIPGTERWSQPEAERLLRALDICPMRGYT
jgi:hypothetical protein